MKRTLEIIIAVLITSCFIIGYYETKDQKETEAIYIKHGLLSNDRETNFEKLNAFEKREFNKRFHTQKDIDALNRLNAKKFKKFKSLLNFKNNLRKDLQDLADDLNKKYPKFNVSVD